MSKYIKFTNGVLAARYDSEIHGERLVSTIDPSFIWPQVEQQNYQYDPETSLDGPTIFVDDPSITPPTILVDNPDCKIPGEAVEVSDELFYRTINETDGNWSLINGEIMKLPFPPPTTESLIAAKRAEINAAFEQSMQLITSGYPSKEVSSWSKQEAEARAYVANNSAATPLIDALASSRSVNKAELVTRIFAKADLFAGVSGTLIGRRQGLEDDLNALPATATPEEIAAITW